MNNTFDRTFDAIISLVVSRDPLLVLFFDGESKRCVFSFDKEKPGDAKQIERLCQFAGITDKNLIKLDKKRFRLIANANPKSNAYGIGHAEEDQFFLLSGRGELMTQKNAYNALS